MEFLHTNNMKITRKQLEQIIKEEINETDIGHGMRWSGRYGSKPSNAEDEVVSLLQNIIRELERHAERGAPLGGVISQLHMVLQKIGY